MAIEALLDAACEHLRRNQTQASFDGLLSLVREARSFLGFLARRIQTHDGDPGDAVRSAFSDEIARLKRKKRLTTDQTYRLRAFEAVLRVLDGAAVSRKAAAALKKVDIS